MVASTSSARNDFWVVTTATAVLFFFCNPMLCVTGAWLLTGTSSSSTSNPSLVRRHGTTTRREEVQSIIFTTSTINTARTVSTTSLNAKDDKAKETSRSISNRSRSSSSPDIDSIKAQLTEYLAKRKEIGADDLAKNEIGKIVGGTKGNKILEYVSAAPNKAVVVKEAPNPLDYDELTRYGYGHLVTPIMNSGGRLAMYRLLGMDPPPLSSSRRKKKTYDAPKLVIDKTGATDKARYSGLKLGQVIDDSMQAAALENVQRKIKNGQELRRRLQEEDYIPPFADKRNTGPRQTPDWTPELLDEMGKKQGRVEAWARRAKAGAFVNDPMETLDLSLQQRVFSIVMALTVATAFGKSTSTFLTQTTHLMSPVSGGGDDTSSAVAVDAILHVLQAPAVGLLAAAIGSMVYCVLDSSQKNRNPFVWAVKGLLGGPISVRLIRELEPLLTNEEMDNNNAIRKQEKDAPN